MKAFQNLKTAYKLSLAFALLAVIVVVILARAYQGLADLRQSQSVLYEDKFKQLELVNELRIGIETSRSELQRVLLAQDVGDFAAFRTRILQESDINRQTLDALVQIAGRQPALSEDVQQLARTWKDYYKTRTTQLVEWVEQRRFQEVAALSIGVQSQRIEQIRESSERITEQVEAQIQNILQINTALVEQQRWNMIVSIAGIVTLMALVVWVTTRAIATPLTTLTQWADQIADGDLLSAREFEQRRDEVGMLSQAFVRMSGYLRELARKSEFIARGDLTLDVQPKSERDLLGNAFAAMLVDLRALMAELHDSVTVLATASQEILATTGQVASSAQETAAAVAEITTTVEEVKQTATLASQKARQVGDVAQRTLQVSQDGRTSVESTLDGMSQVREQMHSVAESIVRLSEQSQAIGDVVATVGDLAEQSNLLGVNASIEAAKAGEQGRGFSVVAQEIKTLADQSKQATVQVRAILNDIQKAMNRVVLAAEESSKVVDSGYRQAQSSGVAIRTLAENIEESSGAALQIAASSQQQLVGMDQVASAMESIKQASQDNVAGTRQAEQAARNLHQLGQRLKDRLSQFKV